MAYNDRFTADSGGGGHHGGVGHHGAPHGGGGGYGRRSSYGGGSFRSTYRAPPFKVYNKYNVNVRGGVSSFDALDALSSSSYSDCLFVACLVACISVIVIGSIMAVTASPASGVMIVEEVCYSGVALAVVGVVAIFFLAICCSAYWDRSP